ncbi:MAG: GtrA family protein [Faecousia sp.]
MIKKLRALIGENFDVMTYAFFGALTTIINYVIYLPCYNLLHMSATVSNILAWAAAVLFAYLTNKPFVFHSHDWSAKVVWPELCKFVACRIGSGAVETGVVFLAVDCLHWNGNWVKMIVGVLVVIINFFGSKLLVFREK